MTISSRRLILICTLHQVIPNICTKFQNPKHSSSWVILDTNFPVYYIEMRDEKKGKMKNRSIKYISASWFSVPKYTWPLWKCRRNLTTLAFIEAEKSVTENLIGGNEKWTNKENGKNRRQIFFYTIQRNQPSIYTKFQRPRCSSYWEILDTKFIMYYNGVRDGKFEKESKLNPSIFVFFPTI